MYCSIEQMSKYIVNTLKIMVLKWEKREMNVEWEERKNPVWNWRRYELMI